MSIRSVAVIVGIDEYEGEFSSLTSAVKDAVLFRDALVTTGLVAGPQDVRLLTAPLTEGARGLPTYKNITAELFHLYRSGETVARMFFFFSGHGLSAYEDGSHAKVTPTIAPLDVKSLDADGRELIDLDELRKYFELTGPEEQLYFIDACRNLSYDHYPSVGRLGWGGGPGAGVQLGAARAQATLWAVAPLYTAKGRRDGNGVMTGHLVDALKSDRIAVAYQPQTGDFAVTAHSISDYVCKRVEVSVGTEPAWKLKYMLPRLDHKGLVVSPLRKLAVVPQLALTIRVEPDSAAPSTDVKLGIGGNVLHSLPPLGNPATVTVTPQQYLLTASSTIGSVEPAREVVDVRLVDEAVVRVTPSSRVAFEATPASVTRAEPRVEVESGLASRGFTFTVPGSGGTVRADALEPDTVIELVGLEPPYERYEARHSLDRTVPAGPYRIAFRLGADVFNSRTIYVVDGETQNVRPTVDVSPALAELTGMTGPTPSDIEVSESIGPMQAGVLPTVLPILGIKPFDVRKELFHQFDQAFEGRYRSADEFGGRPLSVVFALDGNGWDRPTEQIITSVECIVDGREAREAHRLEPLPNADLRGLSGRPSDRIATLLLPSPARSFSLSFRIPGIQALQVWCGSLARRATVVTLVIRPDGTLDVSQNILRIPGWSYDAERVPQVKYGKLLRQLQIAQRLFKGGELLEPLGPGGPNDERALLWKELLYAKWSDPILGCMAYHAWRSSSRPEADWVLPETARNLYSYFGQLPDAQVVYATQFPAESDAIMSRLIAEEAIPVLAVNVRLLADFALKRDRRDAMAIAVAGKVLADQVWTAYLAADPRSA